MNLSFIVSLGTFAPALTERKLGSTPQMRFDCCSSVEGVGFVAGLAAPGLALAHSAEERVWSDWKELAADRFAEKNFAAPRTNDTT